MFLTFAAADLIKRTIVRSVIALGDRHSNRRVYKHPIYEVNNPLLFVNRYIKVKDT